MYFGCGGTPCHDNRLRCVTFIHAIHPYKSISPPIRIPPRWATTRAPANPRTSDRPHNHPASTTPQHRSRCRAYSRIPQQPQAQRRDPGHATPPNHSNAKPYLKFSRYSGGTRLTTTLFNISPQYLIMQHILQRIVHNKPAQDGLTCSSHQTKNAYL